MTRLDRYILRQLFAASGFFLLVFTGVIWLTQAVRLIDTVIASGQGGGVFLLFSAFVLPQVMVIVLPLSALGAALYALNKLYSDSELVVKQMNGVYKVKHPDMITLWRQASTLRRGFEAAEIRHVRREQNKQADALANRAMDLQESHLVG